MSVEPLTIDLRKEQARGFSPMVTHEGAGSSSPAAHIRFREELRSSIAGEVRFDPGTRAAYSADASNYRQVPIGVVLPRTIDDVVTTVAACRRYGLPMTSRGGGTSLAGQACNAAVIIDYSKYLNRVVEIDPDQRTAVVEPGCVLDTLLPDPRGHHHRNAEPSPETLRPRNWTDSDRSGFVTDKIADSD